MIARTTADALATLRPGAAWVCHGNDYAGIEWLDQAQSKPTQDEVSAWLASPTVNDVVAERSRRFALGFDYDFQDARGVHRIATTKADMEGWDDVTKLANALIDVGDTQTQIAIVTDTGPTQVTAPEWQAVILYGAQIRQVIWAKSFALQAMNPIPSDYTSDAYWT